MFGMCVVCVGECESVSVCGVHVLLGCVWGCISMCDCESVSVSGVHVCFGGVWNVCWCVSECVWGPCVLGLYVWCGGECE